MRTTSQVLSEISAISAEEWREKIIVNRDAIAEAMEVYLELRELIANSDSFLFRWMFFAFYGMRSKLNQTKKERFFEYFEALVPDSIENVREIVNNINGDPECGSYYSFVTKMLNMKNENFYPIYDSRIANMLFGCDEKTEMDLDGKEECYRRIKDLYDSICDSFPALQVFHEIFPEAADNFGKMRLLDFIFYNTIPL